jgi:Tfp pilus assembly protein PilO
MKQLLSTFGLRVIVLLLVDIFAFILLLVVLSRLQSVAKETRLLRLELAQTVPVNPQAIQSEITSLKEQLDKLSAYLPDEEGLIEFVSRIDHIKSEGVLVSFSFASMDPVKDASGNIGFPIVLTLRGSWDQINQTQKELYDLPYFIRPIDIRIEQPGGTGEVTLTYGGFIYANEVYEKN